MMYAQGHLRNDDFLRASLRLYTRIIYGVMYKIKVDFITRDQDLSLKSASIKYPYT